MGEEKTLKLGLLFIVMDLLTLLAYPIVFVHGKIRQFSKSKVSILVPNLIVAAPVTPGK
jgi:NADH:ubiquinone oxidoreductase subunit 3 (subunit A)